MHPRPILKSHTRPTATTRPASSLRAAHVHFPPTPHLVATYLTHSGRSYDRSAIVVSPNDCALPERNCPSRTYVLSEGKRDARLLKAVALGGLGSDEDGGDEVTPSSADHEVTQKIDYFSVAPPFLSPDITSSESEESDGLVSPSSDEAGSHCVQCLPIPIVTLSISDTLHTRKALPSPDHVHTALSFLPHPLPPARERKRSLSPHNRQRKTDKSQSFPARERGSVTTRRPHAASFTPDLPQDFGCLGGF